MNNYFNSECILHPMKRTIYADLLQWKDRPDRKPLILEGVRQCGKTFIIKEFGRNEFDSMIYVDLEKRRDLHGIFGDNIDPRRIVRTLETLLNRKAVPGRTLLVFDEAQECPRSLTALKYFCDEAPEYHVICAGSLLGILTSDKKSFPVGKVDRLRMYPMSFLEFLDASGEPGLREYLESRPEDETVPSAIHDRLVELLREYYVVGGMPDVVFSWISVHSLAAVTRKLRTIIQDYKDDFAKHASADLQKLTDIWDSIPVQMGKENAKFMFGQVRRGGRASDLSDALEWMVDAGLVYKVNLAETPQLPLKNSCDASSFKVYMCDIGILRIMSGRKPSFLASDNPAERLFKGGFTENYVLCQMLAGGLEDIFYWRAGPNEVDFLVDGDDGPVPIEVKAEGGTGIASLKAYMKRYSPSRVVLTTMEPFAGKTYGRVPLYGAGLIPRYLSGEAVAPPREGKRMRLHREFFTADDWIDSILSVPASRHGVGLPAAVQVYRQQEDGYVKVEVGVCITAAGDVELSGGPFDGFVSIE